MDQEDPISQFFPNQEDVDLYAVFNVKHDATADEVKKAYRRLALLHHPDKHATATEDAKADASAKFQQIGFAYAVLGDPTRKARYDSTGKTDEGGIELGPGEDGWDAYFEELFENVTRGRLDEFKKDYQGSAEEIEDLKNAYTDAEGSIEEIMAHIPHSTHDDEPRFIQLLSDLISSGDLPSLANWESSIHDEKARLVRQKQGAKEAKEAEKLAKDLGVWDEFYGSGKPAAKKSRKGKGKQQTQEDEQEEDHSALQALMLKRKKNMGGFFDDLAAKYAEPEPSPRSKGGKKRSKDEADDMKEPPRKKSKAAAPPDIDDQEFAQLQAKLFDKSPRKASSSNRSKGGKGKRGKS